MKKAKKAVSLVKTFLQKRKRASKAEDEDDFDVKDAKEKDKKTQKDLSENFNFHRLCSHCVLVYDKLARRNYFQEIAGFTEQVRRNSVQKNKPRSIFIHPQNAGTQFLEESNTSPNCDQDSRSVFMHSIRGHVFKCWQQNLDLNSHFPSFLWIRETDDVCFPSSICDHEEYFVVRINMKTLCSSQFWCTEGKIQSLPGIRMLEVWALVNKGRSFASQIYAEKNLKEDLIESFEWELFLKLPSSYEERYKRLEELFQAVDEIIDLSLYISLASGDLDDNMAAVKEAIIETATVITGTAAESTATVGIETAALSMGQAAAGVALSVLVDVALTARSITKAKIQRDKGLITQNQFKTAVRRHLCDSGCQFIGGTTGTIVGQVLIPVPVVGAIVGGFFGSLIGVGVSKGIIKTSELISEARLKNQLKAIKDTS